MIDVYVFSRRGTGAAGRGRKRRTDAQEAPGGGERPSRRGRRRAGGLALLAALCLLLPAGCGSAVEPADPVTEGFRCTAELDYGDRHYVCTLTCPGGGAFRLRLDQPALLEGLTMDWDGEGFTLSYLGLERRLDGSGLPDTAFAEAVREVLQTAGERLMGGDLPSGGRLEGGSQAGDYTLLFSDDGYPAELSLPALDLEVDFKDFEVLGS